MYLKCLYCSLLSPNFNIPFLKLEIFSFYPVRFGGSWCTSYTVVFTQHGISSSQMIFLSTEDSLHVYINLFCSVILSISIHSIRTQRINNQQPARMQYLSVVCKTSKWKTVSLLFNTNFTMSKYNLRILYHTLSHTFLFFLFFLPIRQYCRSDHK